MNAEVGSPTPLDVTTSDGVSLEAEYHLPEGAAALVVLSHPHPQYGGDMFNPLIDQLYSGLPAVGVGAVRYNFRGVGRSGGSHGEGVAERLDARAMFDATHALAAAAGLKVPIYSAGWSFGADVSLATDHPQLAGWIGIAAPLAIVDPTEMGVATDTRPTLLLVPEHDQFRTPDGAQEVAGEWANTRIVTIAGGDHFLMGRSQPVLEQIAAFVGRS